MAALSWMIRERFVDGIDPVRAALAGEADPEVRATAARLLFSVGSPGVLRVLERMVTSRQPAYEDAAAFALGGLAPGPQVLDLLALAAREACAAARKKAVSSLNKRAEEGHARAAELLAQLGPAGVLPHAVEDDPPAGTPDVQGRSAAELLALVLKSPDAWTRKQAARWAQEQNDPDLAQMLWVHCEREEDQTVRSAIAMALGERYGWVPDRYEVPAAGTFDWVMESKPREHSITALEVMHGVPRNPAMAGHAFFYFRDPSFLEDPQFREEVPRRKPEEPPGTRAVQEDFIEPGAFAREKLSDLKDQIRRSGFPVMERYPCTYEGLDALGKVILGGLGAPERREGTVPEEERLRHFGDLVLSDLWGAIEKVIPEKRAEPWEVENNLHESLARRLAAGYVGRVSEKRRLGQHAEGEGEAPLVVVGESGTGRRRGSWWRSTRSTSSTRGGGAHGLTWLPRRFPRTVRVVLSTLDGPCREALAAREVPARVVTPLSDDDHREIARKFLERHGKKLSEKTHRQKVSEGRVDDSDRRDLETIARYLEGKAPLPGGGGGAP